ncbi:flavodoxin family protein [Dethiobacter alkaliphilus]|uniref:flavodoxin family protein n=1 Tax=Dethiobacter alkaliphilus TaxID=427926 RepID=UPI002227CEFF|nr:NAD(P)H-dependent oxidoreductase [Dethiobacter alkaliphilus]MCW3490487.1 NAD(P)H-dependent oxidoreductase [Dethiobacter alkaliphilus]
MKILAVMGSSKHGNTTEIVNFFAKKLSGKFPCEIEYLYLSDYEIDFCVGCHNCFFIGEEKCLSHPEVKKIEDKLLAADAVILATPGYMFSVTGIMKNFLDHVAYNCHRPKYFGKKAYLISSCTKWQEKSVFAPMETWASGAGFTVAGKEFVEMLPFPLNENELDKRRKTIEKAAAEFSAELKKDEEIKPGFGGIMIFHAFRVFCKIAPNIFKADYEYFKEKNAYDKDAKWYVPAKVSGFRHLLASFMEKRIEKDVSKMIDHEKLSNPNAGFRNKL